MEPAETTGTAQQSAYFLVPSFRKGRGEAERRAREAADSSSSGDDRLSEAFGIDRSLTLTPKVHSLNVSDPQTEASPAFTHKFMRFLNEEEEPRASNFKLSSDFKSKVSKLCRKPSAGGGKLIDFSVFSTNDSRQKGKEGSCLEEQMQLLRVSSGSSSPARHHPSVHPRTFLPVSASFHGYVEPVSPFYAQTLPGFGLTAQPQLKPRNANHKGCRVNSLDYIIDPDRIEQLRLTTLYIANIPNKYTKKMLMKLVDDRFAGRYDFFYLPIDFENKCNVGYAFINFMTLESVRSFFCALHRKKWPRFNSSKICEVRYAKIQGKDNCIRHFANSCLMKQEDDNLKPFIRFARQR